MLRPAARFVARALPRVALSLGALAGLAAPAWACPYCAVSQGNDTLIYILAFILTPYLIVSGVLFWMRRLLRSEQQDAS
jgi:hypothetical protein